MDNKKRICFDMDGVLVDFKSGIAALQLSPEEWRYCLENEKFDEVPGIFSLMQPVKGAIIAVRELAKHYDLAILSTAPWNNPSAWTDKVLWIKRYFNGLIPPEGKNKDGNPFYKKITISHNKDMVDGDWLIDDNMGKNGAGGFKGKKIWFRLPGNEKAQCPEDKLSEVVECHNWYDALDVLMPANDQEWRLLKDELM